MQLRRQTTATAEERPDAVWRRAVPLGLSGKLLLLTILFVMLAEVLIFVPSMSNFRRNFLQERLNAAQIAALSAEAAPNRQIPKMLRDELLRSASVRAVALKRNEMRLLVLEAEQMKMVADTYDLRETSWTKLIMDALKVFVAEPGRTIRITGVPSLAVGDFIEVVLDERPLQQAIYRFAVNIAGLSLIISAITAALVYVALNALLVRPMRRLTGNMLAFSKNPEDARLIITPSARRDEIGTAERELAGMQEELLGTLRQKNHLAALGLAVSKINHDLRNILANAQIISDHLGTIDDPTVQRLTPRLIGSLDRAIRLCSDTLHYGRAKESRPECKRFPLLPLVTEVADANGLPVEGEIDWRCTMPGDIEVLADRDQLYRVLANLMRNARQAIEEKRLAGDPATPPDAVIATARQLDGETVIEIADSGPGIPEKARAALFEAFRSTTRRGGSGLGLAIAAEILRAHGGSIELAEAPMTTFRITLPRA
jgi:signal transduction histidine kinase